MVNLAILLVPVVVVALAVALSRRPPSPARRPDERPRGPRTAGTPLRPTGPSSPSPHAVGQIDVGPPASAPAGAARPGAAQPPAQSLRTGPRRSLADTFALPGARPADEDRAIGAACEAVLHLSGARTVRAYLLEGATLVRRAAAGPPGPDALALDPGQAPAAAVLDVLTAEHRDGTVLAESVCSEGQEAGAVVAALPSSDASPDARQALALLALHLGTVAERAVLRERALTDPLLGLPNRTALEVELNRELARSARTGAPLCAAIVDMDDFKRINDTAGHQAGDRALKAAAARWRSTLRDADLLARFGGDEFALLLPGCPLEQGYAALERLRAATPHGLGCSVGLAAWQPGDTADSLLSRADRALFDAKRAGRGRTQVSGEAPPSAGGPFPRFSALAERHGAVQRELREAGRDA